MPIYEYKCNKCGHITEAWQTFSDPPVQVCGACGGSVRKIMSNNTFRLKGSGWYVTDYSSKSNAHQPTKKTEKETKTSDKGETASKKEATKET